MIVKGTELRRFTVPGFTEPARLDRCLSSCGWVESRSQAKLLVDAGRVRVDGRVRKAGFLLRGGESVEIRPAPQAPAAAVAEDIPLRILYEDDDLLAIDKPAGMVVHPGPGSRQGTVVNALLHRGLCVEGMPADRPGIVHRLDKETSGVLLVARTLRAHEAVSRAFRQRKVEKRYLAIVLGRPRSPAGMLRWQIGRHPRERKRMSIHSRRGRSAETAYEVLESFGELSLLRLRPETGRTHQIRVHLSAMGHPVLGDPLYGSRRGRALPSAGPGRDFGRQALHAVELSLLHPVRGTPLVLVAPLPDDMRELIGRLRAAAAKRS